MKNKIDLEKIPQDVLPEELLKALENDSIFEVIDIKKLEEIEGYAEEAGYKAAEITILDRKYGIFMKQSLADAIRDPQAGDSNILRGAGRKVNDLLKEAYTKRQLKPLESNFERTLFETYVNSLLMNLLAYPTEKFNEKTIEELGLNNPDISKLYTEAMAAWTGSGDDIEMIIKGTEATSHIKTIGFTGKTERIDLSSEHCSSGSHYTLKIHSHKQQIDVQVKAPEIDKSYMECEDAIVAHISEHSANPIITQNARNLVRLTINLAKGYNTGKPLPLQWQH